MPSVVLIECDDETTSWQRAPSSVESQCNQALANTNRLTMSKRCSVSKCLTGSIGLASDESSESWVAFTMNGSLEMGNVYACDATSKSQCSVSKRTPEIHNYTYTVNYSHMNTETLTHAHLIFIWVSLFLLCIENFFSISSKFLICE